MAEKKLKLGFGKTELILVVIDLVDNISDGLCIGMEESIQVTLSGKQLSRRSVVLMLLLHKSLWLLML